MIALLLAGCGQPGLGGVAAPPAAPPLAPAPGPVAPPSPPEVVALAAGERTLCEVDAGDRIRCEGALSLTGVVSGALRVTDREVCGRSEGQVRCLTAMGTSTVSTPFVEVLRGPGAPCGRTQEGAVFCFARPEESEATAVLVPLELPAPAVALASQGTLLFALLSDGRLVSTVPPGHGGSRPHLVATEVQALAGDDWTTVCWLGQGRLACTDREPVPSTATRLAVSSDQVCAAGPGGVECEGPGDLGAGLGEGAVDGLAVGTGFACVLRRGEVSCAGRAPR